MTASSSVWKLSIKPQSGQPGKDSFAWCRTRGVIGVGWAHVHEDAEIDRTNPLSAVERVEGEIPYGVRRLALDVKQGHYVWIHQEGGFHLCKVVDDEVLLGPDLGSDYLEVDIGHARRAEWVSVPEDMVPGNVQRATIAPKLIQLIRCSKSQVGYFSYLHDRLKADPDWHPTVLREAEDALTKLSIEALSEVASPDDWEDVVATYLQTRGWVLVKSSCFRSKPVFEFRLVRQEGDRRRIAYAQVKSGASQLRPEEYASYVSPDSMVFLFSTHRSNPYPGPSVEGVTPLDIAELQGWMVANVLMLPQPLLVQAQLLAESGSE